MALGLTVSTKYGADINATYWNLASYSYDLKNKRINVVMHGFANQTDRLANANFIASKIVPITGAAYQPDLTRAQIYTYIKTLPAWAGATDL